jgi:hypothetical protein
VYIICFLVCQESKLIDIVLLPFFFFFLTRLELSLIIKTKPEGKYNSPKANIQSKATNHGRRPEEVNRDTESLTTKLGTNPSLKQLPKQQTKIT